MSMSPQGAEDVAWYKQGAYGYSAWIDTEEILVDNYGISTKSWKEQGCTNYNGSYREHNSQRSRQSSGNKRYKDR